MDSRPAMRAQPGRWLARSWRMNELMLAGRGEQIPYAHVNQRRKKN